ncbi:efr3 [Hyphodiscus hymeniophilus]|uniref:Efr3 n=1 Tax=Hyphodiscus hymeniophilus TaxID=353542 RepID=A0A9P6VNZ9_9HELO|nr:efr3 [Hyphodiscus hymeniophilus]
MHAIRQKCRPKHQVLILKCYPRTTKGAVDVKPNSSELSYLLYYATTRRSKVQKVGAFLEKKTASDVWRARIGNVQVTLQILAALIEKAPRDLPLYAPYVLKILNIILRSRDITMVESSIPTFEAFCEHHDGASLSADQEYLHQYEEIVHIYASFASTRPPSSKTPISAPVAMRWRGVGLRAIKSVASADALASVAGRQLDVTVPILLENLWTVDEDFLNILEHRMQLEEKVDKEKLLKRRTSVATVRTVDNSTETNTLTLSETTADADKLAEEDTGVLALQCLKEIFVVNNRPQIHGATHATLKFISERITEHEPVMKVDSKDGKCRGWATRVFELIARWTPVQDRYVILVTAMDTLIRSPLVEANLQQQYVLATMIDSLLKSDINLIGLSVMDVLLGLIQHVLRVLQLSGAAPHLQQDNGGAVEIKHPSPPASIPDGIVEISVVPTDLRRDLLTRLQECIGDLATHVYYTDQISDMVSALLLRLKPSQLSGISTAAAAIENPTAAANALTEVGDMTEDPNTDGFFSFDTAKVKALEAIKSIIIVASHRKSMTGVGSLGRSRVPLKVWEGTQWLLRDPDGNVRKAYVDALLTWLDLEMTKSDRIVVQDKPKGSGRTLRDDPNTNLSKRAVSNASHRDRPVKSSRTTFLQLLHLAIYENALQYLDNEPDIVLLHLLLTNLVENLGVNAVKDGLPMIFRLQEDILELETPISKIRIGSLCHGYFWTLSEHFDFDTSPTGRAVHGEIHRRMQKRFWIDRIRMPPLKLDQIGTPGQAKPQQALPHEEVESESLRPFDDRFQMVKLISLSYAESVTTPPGSAPTSPGRSFTHPILSTEAPSTENQHTIPEKVKDQMMSEWSRESVIAIVQESSKTVSLNGSRAGTNATGHRNFLAVNGNLANREGTSSGQASPQGHHHHNHKSRPNSTYGLVGGLGSLQKLRQGSGHSPSPASESSHNSVTRVDQLKRILSGQQSVLPGSRGVAHSDASSESMVSYDFTASEASFNPAQQNVPLMERSVSLREPRDRSRSKSQDRAAAPGEYSRPLTSHPVLSASDENVSNGKGLDAVTPIPPVPPIPTALTNDSVITQEHADKDTLQKGRSVQRSTKSRGGPNPQSMVWGEQGGAVVDLESLLEGIQGDGEQKGAVAKPPY